MRGAIVLHVVGTLVGMFAPALLAPVAVAAWYREWWDAMGFVVASILTGALGLGMRRLGGGGLRADDRFRRIEGLAVVAGLWLLVAHLAAIPYLWAGVGFVDAFFESMSGLTTTGATVFTDFGAFGRSIFFWRALTHWIGGIGVIALFVAVLPRLAIGGRELFFAEAAGPTDDKLMPQLRETAIALWKVYLALTAAQVAALVMAGMTLYDAVCHAMATLAAGGLSPHPMSVAGYDSPTIDWIITVFMFAAGANFALQYRAVRGSRVSLVQDEEFRVYASIVVVASLLLAGILTRDGMTPGDAVRHGVFQAVSIVTTTGFARYRLQPLEQSGQDGAAAVDVRRRLCRLGRWRTEGRAPSADGESDLPRTEADAAPARRAAREAGWPCRTGRDPA